MQGPAGHGYGPSQQRSRRQQFDPYHNQGSPRWASDLGYGGDYLSERWGRNRPTSAGFQTEPTLEQALHHSDKGGIERNPFLSGNRARHTEVVGQQNRPRGRVQQVAVVTGEPQQTPRRTNQYPSRKEGEFATAMSRIACHTDLASKGSALNLSDFRKDLNDQLQLALAVKMGLNGSQQINERALYNVVTSQSARGI